MNKPNLKIRQELDVIYEQYIKKFANKHGIQFEYAVSDDLSGPICFSNEWFFNIGDIVYDIDNRLPAGLILRWQEESIEHRPKFINLQSYGTGLRYKDLNNNQVPDGCIGEINEN